MNTLVNFALKEKYEQVKKLRSRLEDIKNILIERGIELKRGAIDEKDIKDRIKKIQKWKSG